MIFLGLGSNLSSKFGNRFKNIDLAIKNLELNKVKVIKKSSFYETPSYPDFKKPKFINIVISVFSKLSPSDLASILISTETKLERKREKKNDPRTCDIDIIDFNSKTINFKCKNLDFTVPHKKTSFRNFVLYPLEEISPNWIHPVSKKHIGILIKNLSKEDNNSILKVKKT
jgi:2-amino-4-hydroxy-6-hydroxymethyldihydropteridine diphosphokinase